MYIELHISLSIHIYTYIYIYTHICSLLPREPAEGEDHRHEQVPRDARRGQDPVEVAHLGVLRQGAGRILECLQEVATVGLGADEHLVQRRRILPLQGHEGSDVVHERMEAAVQQQLKGTEDVKLLAAVVFCMFIVGLLFFVLFRGEIKPQHESHEAPCGS